MTLTEHEDHVVRLMRGLRQNVRRNRQTMRLVVEFHPPRSGAKFVRTKTWADSAAGDWE